MGSFIAQKYTILYMDIAAPFPKNFISVDTRVCMHTVLCMLCAVIQIALAADRLLRSSYN